MELIGYELANKSNSLALKYVGQSAKSPQVWEPEEVVYAGGSEEGSDDEEVEFIIKRFQYLDNKNIRFSGS